jgi:hypothetical protein
MRNTASQCSVFTDLLAVAMLVISLLGAAPSVADPVRTSICAQPGGSGSQIVPTREFDPILPNNTPRTLVNPLNPSDTSPLIMLSLGDSAIWGNGLIDDQKYSRTVAQHVADATGRRVKLISYAHSGANLSTEAEQSYEPLITSDKGRPPGDLNAGLPTTLQQEGCAAQKYRAADAEIILLDGCINDVSAYKIALPFPFNGAKAREIRHRAYEQCSDKMLSLLNNTKADFPKATIIVSNYWRIISKKSSPFGVAMGKSLTESSPADLAMRREFQSLIDAQRRAEKETGQNLIGTDSLADAAAVFQKWSENSEAFLATSQHCFEWAVSMADSKPSTVTALSGDADQCPDAPKVDPQLVRDDLRVLLATVPDDDDFAYGAGPRKHLWSVPISRKRRDNMFKDRLVLCNSHYKGIENAGAHFICTVNATAHPNMPGAGAFSDSIKYILDIAWKRP